MSNDKAEKVYGITKENCLKMVSGMVCTSCGGELTAIETVDNANNPTYWGGCEKCSRFSWGTKKLTYEIAQKLVDGGYIHYNHLGDSYGKTGIELEEWRASQISGTVAHVYDFFKAFPFSIQAHVICSSINPENPIQVIQALGKMVKLIQEYKEHLEITERHGILYTEQAYLLDCTKSILTSINSK